MPDVGRKRECDDGRNSLGSMKVEPGESHEELWLKSNTHSLLRYALNSTSDGALKAGAGHFAARACRTGPITTRGFENLMLRKRNGDFVENTDNLLN